jgi:hypothetical protein
LSVVNLQLPVSPVTDTWSDVQTAKKLPSEPVSFRHTKQWQRPIRRGSPLTSNLT